MVHLKESSCQNLIFAWNRNKHKVRKNTPTTIDQTKIHKRTKSKMDLYTIYKKMTFFMKQYRVFSFAHRCCSFWTATHTTIIIIERWLRRQSTCRASNSCDITIAIIIIQHVCLFTERNANTIDRWQRQAKWSSIGPWLHRFKFTSTNSHSANQQSTGM